MGLPGFAGFVGSAVNAATRRRCAHSLAVDVGSQARVPSRSPATRERLRVGLAQRHHQLAGQAPLCCASTLAQALLPTHCAACNKPAGAGFQVKSPPPRPGRRPRPCIGMGVASVTVSLWADIAAARVRQQAFAWLAPPQQLAQWGDQASAMGRPRASCCLDAVISNVRVALVCRRSGLARRQSCVAISDSKKGSMRQPPPVSWR